jgi:hypothetical protein
MAKPIEELSLEEARSRLAAVYAKPLPKVDMWRKAHERRRHSTYTKIENRLFELHGIDPRAGREFFWKLDLIRVSFFSS